jgi:tRNA threonylcarbamoyladenosine biosynthesis protein TsaE
VDLANLTSTSAAQTETAAAALADLLRAGDVVLLSGDVGAGKTTFVRGACRALGVTAPVTSPSFTIGQRYEGRLPVSHIDLFRLDSLDNEDPALLDDYIDQESVAFVEWPQAAASWLAPGEVALRVSLAHAGEHLRAVEAAGAPRLVECLWTVLGAAPGHRE